MKVGILGSGPVGRALARGFAATGHDVVIGARTEGNAELTKLAAGSDGRIADGSFTDAARWGDLLVIATKGTVLPDVVAAAGVRHFTGKIVIDTTNPLDDIGFPPGLAINGNDSGGETLQRLLPDAKIVKAFNTISNAAMYQPKFAGGPPDMMIAGNDADAKRFVGGILGEFGWTVVDLGPILSARWLEAMCMAWVWAGFVSRDYNRAFKLLPGKTGGEMIE